VHDVRGYERGHVGETCDDVREAAAWVHRRAKRSLARLETIGRSDRTVDEYRRLLTKHVYATNKARDHIGSKRLRDVPPRDVEALHTGCANADATEPPRGRVVIALRVGARRGEPPAS
jgi:hypothetical protein